MQSHPPPSAYMQRTAAAGGRASAMPQSRGGFGRTTETARPMTSNRAAGYTAAGKQGGNKVGMVDGNRLEKESEECVDIDCTICILLLYT